MEGVWLKKTIEVQILGQKVRIRHEDEAYVRQLENFVNERVRMHGSDLRSSSGLQLAIRAMMTIGDEYFTAIKEKESVEKKVEEKTRELIDFIDQKAALEEDGWKWNPEKED
jgi:cell division protein ZapA (FtsZ GTPase activity inhibitor)